MVKTLQEMFFAAQDTPDPTQKELGGLSPTNDTHVHPLMNEHPY